MTLPIPTESGVALICTSGLLDRYAPAIARLIVHCLDTLNIVLRLGRTSDNSESLHAVFCISAIVYYDIDIANVILPKRDQ